METQSSNRHCYAMVESTNNFGILLQATSYERFLIPVLTEGATPTLVGMAKRFVTRRVGTSCNYIRQPVVRYVQSELKSPPMQRSYVFVCFPDFTVDYL